MDYDKEKHLAHANSDSDVVSNRDEALREPPPEESLHRDLKARQISMIAVCVSALSAHKSS
jgi:amino acid transporter